MNRIRSVLVGLATMALLVTPYAGQAAEYHHVHITTSSPAKGIEWYSDHMGCEPLADRDDAADCYGVEVVFVPQSTTGSTQGTGVNHIGFSVPDLAAKMADLEAVGVRGSGVRLQRFPDGAMVRDVPGLFKIAFIFDPWGTRIELVEDEDYLGFHHVHLSATDPAATLAFYRDVLGGEAASLRGQLDGLRFDDVWLLVSEHPEGTVPATTQGRAVDHLGFVVDDLDAEAASMRQAGVSFQEEPVVPENGRTQAKRAFLMGPDNVRIAVVETGFAGVTVDLAPAMTTDLGPYDAPLTPWGEPDLQGVWTSNSSHGIPLERPEGVDAEELTIEEAVARREGGTLGSVWGYEREWRDTTLGYGGAAVSTQVAMIVEPSDGRLPAMTPEGERRAAELAEQLRIAREGPFAGPEDIPVDDRCITGGIPRLMLPRVYNNGLQIVQGPGYVSITKEMIHETRVIPTEPRPAVGPELTQWLGVPQGRWEGDTLVVETTNFNGRVTYLGESEDLRLTEWFTRVGENTMEYRFSMDDPTVWTAPWTAMFRFEKDDEQYELVEYACHEGNYSLENMLTGSQAKYGNAEPSSR